MPRAGDRHTLAGRRAIAAARSVGTPAERLFARVTRVNDCLVWTGSTDAAGYGRLVVGSRIDGTRRHEGVHRVAWMHYHGPIPDGMEVLHTCDNPPCVERGHLFLGNHATNMLDMAAKGRGLHKLTLADVARIRTGGERIVDLAQELGVSPSTVHRHRHKSVGEPTPRQRQIAEAVRVTADFTALQILCHADTNGRHFLTAPLKLMSGPDYRRCIQCEARLPGDYEPPPR